MIKNIFCVRTFVHMIILIALITSFGACKKEQPAPVAIGQVWFHLHSNIDTNEIDTSMISKDHTGRQLKIKLAEFYASGIQLKKSDGTFYNLTGTIILKTIGTEEYFIGNAPAGNYTSVSFNVGLDPTSNAANAPTEAASTGLSLQTPSMWFGTTAKGYIFMNVQGTVDTSAMNNGPVNVPISYQIGTNALLQNVTMPNQTFAVVGNQTSFIHIICDYGLLLKGVNFKTQTMCDPFTNLPLATQIANNIPGMFRYEY